MFDTIETYDAIFKRDTKGAIRTWQVEVGYNSDDHAGYRIISGLEDGNLTTSEWKLTEAKNVGRSNATTAREQAISEAQSVRSNKLERGYFVLRSAVDSFDKFKPMLAAKYEDVSVEFPVFSQPKLDGIRCIARADGLWTRQGKEIVSVPHINKALEDFFKTHPEAILDGELYNHELKDDFNKITSVVRKTKPTALDLEESARLAEYHVYDLGSCRGGFDYRNRVLQSFSIWAHECIKLVPTSDVATEQELDSLYGQYLENGYEGQMVRTDAKYENKRSKTLLKRKEFLTDEFKVVEMLEGKGNWSGYVKRFVLELPDGTQFGAGVRGNQETLKNLLSEATPQWATLRYFTPTPDGIPRFPVVVDWGYGERDD